MKKQIQTFLFTFTLGILIGSFIHIITHVNQAKKKKADFEKKKKTLQTNISNSQLNLKNKKTL